MTYAHPKNRHTVEQLRAMSVEDFFDFRESLEMFDMLEDARHKDFELEMKLNRGGNNGQ